MPCNGFRPPLLSGQKAYNPPLFLSIPTAGYSHSKEEEKQNPNNKIMQTLLQVSFSLQPLPGKGKWIGSGQQVEKISFDLNLFLAQRQARLWMEAGVPGVTPTTAPSCSRNSKYVGLTVVDAPAIPLLYYELVIFFSRLLIVLKHRLCGKGWCSLWELQVQNST